MSAEFNLQVGTDDTAMGWKGTASASRDARDAEEPEGHR
jgi:hypothetical protein